MGCQEGGLVAVFPDCDSGNGGNTGAWIPVSLDDGSWTVSDPAALIDTVVDEGGGIHEFVEQLTAASANLVYSSTTYSAYRAYKALVDADGNAVTCDGYASIDVAVGVLDPSDGPANAIVAMGIAVDPSSTVYSAILASAIGFHQSAALAINGHLHDGAGGSFLTGAAQTGCAGTIILGGDTQVCTVALAYNAAKERVNNGSRNFTASPGIGGATPLFLWVEYSKRLNTDAGVDDASVRCSLRYRVNPVQALP
jgi:hypothetical protein